MNQQVDFQNEFDCAYGIAWDLFDFVEPDRTIRKPHWLDKHLAFGFRKDDVALPKLVDQWTNRDRLDIGAFEYWAVEKYIPFSKHGKSLKNRFDFDNPARSFIEDVVRLIQRLHKDDLDPSGICYTNIEEIQCAICLILLDILRQYKPNLASGMATSSADRWENRIAQIRAKAEQNCSPYSLSEWHGYKGLRSLLTTADNLLTALRGN